MCHTHTHTYIYLPIFVYVSMLCMYVDRDTYLYEHIKLRVYWNSRQRTDHAEAEPCKPERVGGTRTGVLSFSCPLELDRPTVGR